VLPVGAAVRAHAKDVLKKAGASPEVKKRPVVGLNTGSGRRFAGKRLPVRSWVALAERFYNEMGMDVWLLGGEDEIERNNEIKKSAKTPVVHTGSHDILTFAGMVELCDLVISGDTTAMHIAIAMKTPIVAYFASTCAAEIELYGRGKKIISNISCAPCYLKDCPIQERCMEEMDPAAIVQAAKGLLSGARIA
jgi:heptosyltransferase-2